MRNKSINAIWGGMLCLFFITACGGGGGGGSTTPSTPNISVAGDSDFAGIVLDNYIDRKFIVTNTGNASLSIGTIVSPAAPFSISDDTTCSGHTLAPSQTCSLMARFYPTTIQGQGHFTGTISIPSNLPTVTINLSGDGYGLNVWINQVTASSSCPSTISVDVTVTDPSGALGSLAAANFTLKQNGLTQVIPEPTKTDPDPVSVVLALDLSGSLTTQLAAIKTAAQSFVSKLRPVDEAAICKFRDQIAFYPVAPLFYTTDSTGKPLLETYIGNTDEASLTDGTALYDAVHDSIDRAFAGTKGKKVVIVLSDGVDNPQHIETNTLASVIAYANLKGIPVFTIFYVDLAYYPGATPAIMQQSAHDTGGQYYNSDNTTDLTPIFQQIFNVLSNKYTIGYTSSTCSGSIPLEVRADYGGLYGVDSRTIILP
jgi:VWFA-related protein